MAPMIGFALTPQTPARGGATPPQPTGDRIAIEPFSRDRALFDGGAAFGRAEASVPLRGSATPGRAVEARAVAEGGGATEWTRVATADASGAWSGAIAVPRGPRWMRPEVRLEGSPGVAAQGANRFGVGHVLAIWGQSEIHHMLHQHQDQGGREALLDDDAVQIVWHDRASEGAAGVLHKHLTTADPHTGAVSALANALMAERPGEKFCVVFQVEQGTHFYNLVRDDDMGRSWAADAAVHAFATADGQHVGAAAASWFAAPSNLGDGYEEALFPLFTGRAKDGTPVAIPGEHVYTENNVTNTERFDHWFGELYDPAHTRWVPYGPHRFEPEGDLRNAVTRADGRTDFKLRNIERCRRSWREMVANPNADGLFLPITVEPLNYLNGERDAGGNWGDITHPAADTLDGLGRLGRLTAHAYLRSTGLTDWPVPEFDGCAWDDAGAWVELWSSAGPVTTTRRARDLPPVGADHPHWTEVVGFEIDGAPAQRAEITPEGRVRVYPLAGAFTAASVLTFGAGGATGALNRQDDLTAGLWMNLPIVEVGAAGVEGIAVRPLPDPALLASTVGSGGGSGTGGTGSGSGSGGSGSGGSGSGDTGSDDTGSGGSGSGGSGGTGSGGSGTPTLSTYFTRDGTDAHFVGPTLGAGVAGITAEMVVRLREQTVFGMQKLFEVTSTSLALEIDMRAGREQLRVTVEDSTGAKLILNAYSGTGVLPLDRWITIRLAALQDVGDGTGFARVTVDGAAVFPPAGNPEQGRFATGTGHFASSRSFELLRSSARLDMARVAIWKEARPDGATPASMPFKVIEGGAAAANADAWKAGTGSFT